MLSANEYYLFIGSVTMLSYIIVNNKIGFKMKKQFCETQYRSQYFHNRVNKIPFLFVFFTVFVLLYYKKHKDEYEHGYDLFLLSLIEDLKHSSVYSKFDVVIEDENILKSRIKMYERKKKLKNINKLGRFN